MRYEYKIEGVYEDPDTNTEEFKSFAECNGLQMALEIRDLYQSANKYYAVWILKYDKNSDAWDELSLKDIAYFIKHDRKAA